MKTENNGKKKSYCRILFCTDFSENAWYAFGKAFDVTTRLPGCAAYLHALSESEPQFGKSYIYELNGLADKAGHDGDEKFVASYHPRVPSGVELRLEMRVGSPEQRTLEFLRVYKAGLITLYREGHGGRFGKILFGIVHRTKCPVVAVPYSWEGSKGRPYTGEMEGADSEGGEEHS